MSTHDLPPNWAWTTLGEICEVGAGGPAPQDDASFAFDGTPFVRVQDMGRLQDKDVYVFSTRDSLAERASSDLTLFPKGTVLFTKSGMSTLLNQRAILGRDMHVVSHVGTCVPLGELSSEWVYYWLKTVDFKDLTHATTLPSLQLPKVKAIETPLAPLPEQRRIVARIEELFSKLDAGVEELKKARAQLKRYRQSVLKAAFEGKLTEEWRKAHKGKVEPASVLLERIKAERKKALGKKYKEPPSLDTSELPELPEGWVYGMLGDFIYIAGRIGWRGLKAEEYTERGPLFLSVYNLNRGMVADLNDVYHITTERYEESPEIQLRNDDILLAKDGAGIGKVAIVKKLQTDATVNSSLLVIRSGKAFVPEFLLYLLAGPMMQRIVRERISGSATPHLFQRDIKKLVLLVPPVEEQRSIVAQIERRLSVLDTEVSVIDTALKQAARLRQSILKRAFEGRLVPQDSSDEPAERLLERIRAEKARSETMKSRRRLRQ